MVWPSALFEVYTILLYVIRFVSDLEQVCGFIRMLVFYTRKTNFQDITGSLNTHDPKLNTFTNLYVTCKESGTLRMRIKHLRPV